MPYGYGPGYGYGYGPGYMGGGRGGQGPHKPGPRIDWGHPLESLTEESREPFKSLGKGAVGVITPLQDLINDTFDEIPFFGFIMSSILNAIVFAAETVVGLGLKAGSGLLRGIDWITKPSDPKKEAEKTKAKDAPEKESDEKKKEKETEKSKDKEAEVKDNEAEKAENKESEVKDKVPGAEEEEADKKKDAPENTENPVNEEAAEENETDAKKKENDPFEGMTDEQIIAENKKLKEQIAAMQMGQDPSKIVVSVEKKPAPFNHFDQARNRLQEAIKEQSAEKKLGTIFPASPLDKGYFTAPPENVYGNYPALGSNLRTLRDQSMEALKTINNTKGAFKDLPQADQDKVADAWAALSFDKLLRHSRAYNFRLPDNKLVDLGIENKFVSSDDPEKFLNNWKASVRDTIKENLSKGADLAQLKDNSELQEKMCSQMLKKIYKEAKEEYVQRTVDDTELRMDQNTRARSNAVTNRRFNGTNRQNVYNNNTNTVPVRNSRSNSRSSNISSSRSDSISSSRSNSRSSRSNSRSSNMLL